MARLLERYYIPRLIEERKAETVVVCGVAFARCVKFAIAVVFFVVFKIIEVAIDIAAADIHVADNHIHSRRFAQRYEFLLECIF